MNKLCFCLFSVFLVSCSGNDKSWQNTGNLKGNGEKPADENDTVIFSPNFKITKITDIKEIEKVKREWIFDIPYDLTVYYPDGKTLIQAREIFEKYNLSSDNVEFLYFSLPGDRHVMSAGPIFVPGKKVHKFYLLGFDKEKNLALYWLQSQADKMTTIIELVYKVEKRERRFLTNCN
jgi:hypothetical protein